MQETTVRFLDQEDPLEKGVAVHSSVLARKIPWTEETGGVCGVAKTWTWLSKYCCRYSDSESLSEATVAFVPVIKAQGSPLQEGPCCYTQPLSFFHNSQTSFDLTKIQDLEVS